VVFENQQQTINSLWITGHAFFFRKIDKISSEYYYLSRNGSCSFRKNKLVSI